MKHSIFQNLLEIIKTRQFISCLFGWWLKYYVFFLCYCYNVIKHKDVKGIFSFAEFSAAIAKHVFLPLKILIFWFQIVAFCIFNQKLHNSYPCLEQSWHYAGDRLTFSVHTIRRRNLKTQKQSRTGHLDLCLRKPRAGIRDVFVFEVFSVHTKTQSRGSQIPWVLRVFSERISEKLPFRDGLVWTVGLTVEIKLPFWNPPG